MMMMGSQLHKGEKKRKKTEEEIKQKKRFIPATPAFGPEKSNAFLKPFSSKDIAFQDGTTAKNDSETHGVARVAFGAFSGKWFFEVEVISAHPTKESVRVGVTTGSGNLSSPLGHSKDGYGYNSDGRLSHGKSRCEPISPFSTGDVIGCAVDLGQLDFFSDSTVELESVPSSSLRFYKNGVLQDGGFKNLLKGTYYPAISVAHGGSVRINPGPDFKYVPDNLSAVAICQLVPVHLRSSVDDTQLKQKPRMKKSLADGGDPQSHYNQCCHHCRAKPRPGLGVLRCSYHSCTRIFCMRCIRKYYSNHGDEAELLSASETGKWVCLCCTNECVCKACQRVRFRKQESLLGGGATSTGGPTEKTPKGKGKDFVKGQMPWSQSPVEDVVLETYDMEAALGLATLFSIRNSQKPAFAAGKAIKSTS